MINMAGISVRFGSKKIKMFNEYHSYILQQLKILFVIPEYYPHSGAGISTYYLQYINALKPYVGKIKVMVGSGYVNADEQYLVNGIEIEYLNPEIYHSYLIQFEKFDHIPIFKKNIAAAWAMWKQTNMGDGYDIIECCDFGLGYIPWLIHHKKPVVVRLHGSDGQIELKEPYLNEKIFGDFNRQTELLLLSKADRLITHSKANTSFWQLALSGKDVDFIPPVFETDISPIAFTEKENFGIVCGRIQQWKGPDVLCEALRHVGNLNSIIKWFGRDTTYNNYRSKSEQLSIDYPDIWKTRIVPHLPLVNDEIKKQQKQAKFAVVPSTWDMYNFTLLESMAAGTIVICSEEAGASDLVEDGINGFKFSVSQVEKLADHLQQVDTLTEKAYVSITNNAIETIKTLAGRHIVPVNIALYQKVLNNFEPLKPNPYLETIYQPTTNTTAFKKVLDVQSLKKLSKYLAKRILKKYFN